MSSKGIVLKDEVVYKSETEGHISFFKNEGDKVGKGIKIAQIVMNGNDSFQQQIKEIDQQIEKLKQSSVSQETFKQDIDKNQGNIEYIIQEMQDNLLDGNYQKVDDLKNQLYQYMDKHQAITGQKTLTAENIESLLKKKQQLLSDSNRLIITCYSDKAGIISLSTDGLEEIYSTEKLNEYEPEDFRLIDRQQVNDKNNKEVAPGDSIFKIIDNYKWYVMTIVKSDSINDLKEGENLFLEIGKDNKKISARVDKINKSKDDMLIIFKIDEFLHEFYNERYLDVKILKNTYEGLVIPNEAIIEKDSLQGVYIKDISGIVKFRPIKIIGANDEYTIVSEGENRVIQVEVNGEKQNMNTIQMFDEIFVNGLKVKEGQIVD